MLEEKQVDVELKSPEEISVIADDFYIEQVITNYLTNAIKHVEEINGKTRRIFRGIRGGRYYKIRGNKKVYVEGIDLQNYLKEVCE